MTVRPAFAENGDVIVTLLPLNSALPGITPAQFRPELVPEELMAQGLTVSSRITPAQFRPELVPEELMAQGLTLSSRITPAQFRPELCWRN